MNKNWKFNRFRDRLRLLAVVFFYLSIQSSNLCLSLNDEGLALLRFKQRIVSDPFNALSDWREDFGIVDSCSWFGVECSNGQVVVLNLKDLCLGGTLAPELSQLVHIKSIILRNNSLTGLIPEEISELNELEVLDLGYNNFSGPTPADLGNNLSLTILLLDNNGNLGSSTPRTHELEMVSEFQADDDQLSGAAAQYCCIQRPNARNVVQKDDHVSRRVLQNEFPRVMPPQSKDVTPNDKPDKGSISPTPLPSAEKAAGPTSTNTSRLDFPLPSPAPAPAPAPALAPAPAPAPPPPESPTNASTTNSISKASKRSNRGAVMAGAIGGCSAVVVLAVVAFILVKTKVTYVNPWSTGLSGQLKKAFVTGVPKLKRSELETACEDFSNVIGSSSIGTLYKGTLSSGVEIAVACVSATSSKEWSENLELQFLKKIDTLSKVNHKNFVNLIGYCQEDEPFTRMMVFEYAPNGTLFEHLHIREAEHLDWGMRMRIAMGMAYCLDYMHQMEKPIPHNNLSSSAIRLTEDYATKISEFTFWSETSAVAPAESSGGGAGGSRKISEHRAISTECNVYNFGVILFEMVTGRVPYSVDNGSLEDWASDYLAGDRPLGEMADPTLESCRDDQVEEIGRVIRSCVHRDPKRRPDMREVCIRLREITGMTPDAAAPRISPLWWAELELMSDSV